MALRYENRRFFFQGILHAAQYVYLNESQAMSSPRISKTNAAMVGILLYTTNILLSCSIITIPDARFSQYEATKSSIHASKWWDLIRQWANHRGKCVRKRTVRGKKPLSSRLEPFPWTCMRLLSMEESDWILRKMKTVKCHKKMKQKVDLHLEFLKQTSSLNTMTTPLMTMILYQKKMVPIASLNF